MFWWILGGLFVLLCLVLEIITDNDSILLPILAIILMFVIIIFGAPREEITENTPIEEVTRIEIFAINNDAFIFVDSIGDELAYEYLVQNEDDSFTMNSIPASNVKIYADLINNSGYIVKYKQETKTSFWKIGDIRSFVEIHIPQTANIISQEIKG